MINMYYKLSLDKIGPKEPCFPLGFSFNSVQIYFCLDLGLLNRLEGPDSCLVTESSIVMVIGLLYTHILDFLPCYLDLQSQV